MKGVVERLAGLADLLLAKAAPPTWQEKVWPDDLWAPQTPAGGVLPIALTATHEPGAAGLLVLGLIGVASLVGDFYVKYCVVKAGVYVPLTGPEGPPIHRA